MVQQYSTKEKLRRHTPYRGFNDTKVSDVVQNDLMPETILPFDDTPESRKARGAFFTPEPIARFLTEWAIRAPGDTVLDPSAGDAAFLIQATRRLKALGNQAPLVDGIEIHKHSANIARNRIESEGGSSRIVVNDFFLEEPEAKYSAVIGNPPYIRYQDFKGDSRVRSRAAALKAGVSLTTLASSWAAFTIHSALFLKTGGRLGLVLPAELLSVNYASAVRKFLFDRFNHIELVLFTEQVFPGAEADVLLLLADGFNDGPTDQAGIYQAKNSEELTKLGGPLAWSPADPSSKWTSLLLDRDVTEPLRDLQIQGHFTNLEKWGDTTLGMVTGSNRYFALSPARVKELGLKRTDLVRLSPPGSAHLRGLELTKRNLTRLGADGKATWLFHPSKTLSPAAQSYIEAGHLAGVDDAYKCRIRNPWYLTPLLPAADLLLTYMNADTPRLITNTAGVHHLNSVHGVYLNSGLREIGRELLPIASLNHVTMLNAEMVGRSYGGGVLKLEPREADTWSLPSPSLIKNHQEELRQIKPIASKLMRQKKLKEATNLVDEILFTRPSIMTTDNLKNVRTAFTAMAARRTARSRSGH